MNEACGIFGAFCHENGSTARTVYYALYALQHRGQEACGIAINDRADKTAVCYKNLGLVGEVFDDFTLQNLKGDMALGHCLYAPAIQRTRENAQPLNIKYIKGTLSIAHNGAITNADQLRRELACDGAIFQSSSDSEVIAFLLAKERLRVGSIEEAVKNVVPRLEGAFSMLIMSPQKLIAVRDRHGIRPLCMGKRDDDIFFASESCALAAISADFIRDILPGEMIVVRDDGTTSAKIAEPDRALCIFEHVYLARPDSFIDGRSVYEARLDAGRILAEDAPCEADIVIGVPDSGIVAAIGYAQRSGIPYIEGFIKNRYVTRTFIQPEQGMREAAVSLKHGALTANVMGKRVVLVDDSIVRGTTMRQIVALLRRAGADEVHIRISSPEFLHLCPYGTDVPTRDTLASVGRTPNEVCELLGADTLGFLPLSRANEIATCTRFCMGCFCGEYPSA